MPDGSGINREGRKFDQVLEGARRVFMADGYERATVDDIARAAGVSKATLYSYFPDKRQIFMEVATHECRKQADAALAEVDMEMPARDVLRSVSRRLTAFFTSELGQRTFRIFVAEADHFPDLAHTFYETGPGFVRTHLVAYLEEAVRRGEMVIEDIELAADQLPELCKADLWPRMIFGQATTFSDDEIDRVVDGAVDMFVARYGARA